jgi:hypothetical protein
VPSLPPWQAWRCPSAAAATRRLRRRARGGLRHVRAIRDYGAALLGATRAGFLVLVLIWLQDRQLDPLLGMVLHAELPETRVAARDCCSNRNDELRPGSECALSFVGWLPPLDELQLQGTGTGAAAAARRPPWSPSVVWDEPDACADCVAARLVAYASLPGLPPAGKVCMADNNEVAVSGASAKRLVAPLLPLALMGWEV